MAVTGRAIVLVVVCVLLCCADHVDARKTAGVHKVKKLHDRAHASRKYKLHKDARSGRTALVHDKGLKPAPVGRKLRQATGNTLLVSGMSVCPSAADAANYIVGSHAMQLAVSNAAFTAGSCDTAAWSAGAGTGGLMWGIVQTWPADHAMAPMFNATGALVLGSGDVTEAQRVVNDADSFTADNGLPGDADLDSLIPGYTTYDAVVLEFDVTPAKSGELVFQYIFASEEYNEYVNSPFNDVFGFWVSGPGISGPSGTNRLNVAYMPDLVTPISINNINNGQFSQYYHDNDLDPRPTTFPPPSPYNTSYDGFTNLLNTRSVQVQAGQKYHFKLAIADAGDHVLDSAVWIAGGSLLVNQPPKVVTDGPYILPCPGSLTMHANGTDDDHDPLHYVWNLTSATDPNIHIAKLTESAVLTMPDDAIPAGSYSVSVTAVDSHGSRAISQSTLQVLSCAAPPSNMPPKAAFTAAPYTMAVCNGVGSITMDASPSLELDVGDRITRYVWEIDGADLELKLTGPTVTVDASQGFFAGNTYEVEVFVSDSYGASGVAETTLTVVPGAGCSGGSSGGGGGGSTSSGGGGGGGGGGSCTGSACTGVYTEAIISNSPYSLDCGGSVNLDGSMSTSFDSGPLTYEWNFYDDNTGQSFTIGPDAISIPIVSQAAYTQLQLGASYSLTLTVTDSTGSQASDNTTFNMPAACNTPPSAVTSASSYSLPCDGQVYLDGSPSYDIDPGDAVVSYFWAVYAKGSTSNPVTTSAAAIFPIYFLMPLAPGATYDAYLTVSDKSGSTGVSAKVSITVGTCNRPPVAKLSGGLSLSCGGTTQLDGTASSDPDGNDSIAGYTFKVMNLTTLAVVATKTSTNGKATLSQVTDSLKTNTQYLVRLDVQDVQGAVGSANTTLTVNNCAPTAVVKLSSASVACGGSVTLDGTGSSDSDGTISSYSWKLVSGSSSVTKSGATATVSQTTDKLTSGATYNVTLAVTDNSGKITTSAVSMLTVASGCVTNSPPVCTNAKANVTRISTLNHAMIPITITGVTDPDVGDKVTITITNVTQDEGTKASDTSISGTWACPDATIASPATSAKVAAECLSAQSTTVSGRVYTLKYTATDSKGATCSGSVTVCAKPGTSGSCTDDGQKYVSTVCA